MEVLFEENSISYGNIILNLDEIDNTKLFMLLEYIVQNKESIELKLNNPNPFCKKIHEYIDDSLNEQDVEF